MLDSINSHKCSNIHADEILVEEEAVESLMVLLERMDLLVVLAFHGVKSTLACGLGLVEAGPFRGLLERFSAEHLYPGALAHCALLGKRRVRMDLSQSLSAGFLFHLPEDCVFFTLPVCVGYFSQ